MPPANQPTQTGSLRQWLIGGAATGVGVGLAVLAAACAVSWQGDTAEPMVSGFWLMVSATMPFSLAYVWASTQFPLLGSPWAALASGFVLLPAMQGGAVAVVLWAGRSLARGCARAAA